MDGAEMCLKVARLAEEARKRLRGSHFQRFLASYYMSEAHEAACGERTWQQLLRWLVELLVPRVIETDSEGVTDNISYPS